MKGKRSGIPHIAELAGVSIGTVDRALHGRPGINDETRQRVLDIAKKIGYRPNLAARSLSTGRRIRIGVCVPQEIRYFYNELWEGINEEVSRYADRGIEFVLHPIPELGKGERVAFRKIMESGVEGVVVTPGNPDAMTPLIDVAEENGVRVVCVSTDAPGSQRSCIVCVEPRLNGLIAGELMSKFVAPGSNVAIITGMLKTVDHREKAEGFTKSFSEFCSGGCVIARLLRRTRTQTRVSGRHASCSKRISSQSCGNLCQHGQLAARLPRAVSGEARRKRETDRDRSVPCETVSLLWGRDHRCVHAPKAIPPRAACGAQSG